MASNGFTVRLSMGLLFSDKATVKTLFFPSVAKCVVFTLVLRIHIIHVCMYIYIYTHRVIFKYSYIYIYIYIYIE